MKNVFVIHGSFGSPFENWNSWLVSELEKNKIKCFVPHFPTPEFQNYENWKQILDAYRNMGLLSEDSVLVAHSLAPIFIVKYLNESGITLKKIITISGFNDFISGDNFFDEVNKPFFIDESNFDGNHKLAKSVISIFSDNDPFLPLKKLEEFADFIGAKKKLIKEGGHFNSDSGFTAFEDLLTLIIEK